MVRIFLAHAKEDENAVIRLYNLLKQKGYEPWLDKVDLLPGQNWQAEIPKAIKNSDVFIACLSKQSIAKQGYVQREFRMALNKMADRPLGKIYLIPLRLDDCQIPELRQEEYGISLTSYQWVDFFQPDGFERLVKAIEHHFSDAVENRSSENTASPGSFTEQLSDDVAMDMVYIPGGSFLMGSPESEKGSYDRERPQHSVKVHAFYMGKYPITLKQWRIVSQMDSVDRELKAINLDQMIGIYVPAQTRIPHPSYGFRMMSDLEKMDLNVDSYPAGTVTWYEAVEFCKRLSKHSRFEYRLPSEAEWEYACRAGTTTPFFFGKTLSKTQANYAYPTSGTRTIKSVGAFLPNAFGLYDMHGNICEWCSDHQHDNYDGAPTDGSAWLTDNEEASRVARGGGWDSLRRYCRSAYRSYYPVDRAHNTGFRVDRAHNTGFRVVCSAPRIPQ